MNRSSESPLYMHSIECVPYTRTTSIIDFYFALQCKQTGHVFLFLISFFVLLLSLDMSFNNCLVY